MSLPRGWVVSPIGEAFELNPKHPAETDRGLSVSFVPMPAVDEFEGTIKTPEARPLREVWKGYTHFADGDVIFAKITPCMENGKAAIVRGMTNGVACGSTEFHVFRPLGGIQPSYLWRYLRQPSFREIAERQMNGAVGQKRVPKGFLETYNIPLPPLAEQRRIVTKLDALTARLTRARAELDRSIVRSTALRRAALEKAYNYALMSSGHKTAALAKYCSSVADGDHQAPPRSETGIPFITISALNRGYLDLGKASRFVPENYYTELSSNRRAKCGDVLYSVTGSFGIPAVVNSNTPFVFQRHIALLRPKQHECDTKWLWYMMSTPQLFEQAENVATGTAQMTVPLTALRLFQLPYASITQQISQVRHLDAVFARTDRLQVEASRAKKLLDRLESAILAKAFRGELVPQDPDDEPASVLLERIRAQRASVPSKLRQSIRDSASV